MYRSKEIEKYNEYSLPQWSDKYYTYRGTISYGMHYIYNNSQPYFSITGVTHRLPKGSTRWEEDSCGCMSDLIREKAPHLARLLDFHLADQDGLPMYYLENGYYWYKEDLEVFKDYVRLSDDEQIPEIPKIELPVILNDNGTELDLPEKEQEKLREKAKKKFITDWLRTREEKLKQEFTSTMQQFEVEFITQKEIEDLKQREVMNARTKQFNSYLGATPVKKA